LNICFNRPSSSSNSPSGKQTRHSPHGKKDSRFPVRVVFIWTIMCDDPHTVQQWRMTKQKFAIVAPV